MERAQRLGARPVDIGQGDVDLPWVVLTDPEGTEFCVLERLTGLGASRSLGVAGVAGHDADRIALADPEGNDIVLLRCDPPHSSLALSWESA